MLDIITKENITFLMAIIGFLLSIYNFVKDLLQNRMRLKVVYKSHKVSETQSDHLNIGISIQNLTSNNISISRIFLNVDGSNYEFFWVSELVFIHSHACDKVSTSSQTLPCTISSYGQIGGFFCLNYPQLKEDRLQNGKTSLVIHTNKGKKKYVINMNCHHS